VKIATVVTEGRQVWGVVDETTRALTPAVDLAPTLRAFLEAGRTTADLRDLPGFQIPLDGAAWQAPVPNPTKIWCVGLNFDDYRRQLGLDYLKAPNIFLKAPSALAGHDSVVGVPSGYGSVFHEWELTAVVGRRLREASPDEAAAGIFGYTILDDLTFHEIELVSRDHQQWAKNVDGFAPCGPWVVTADELDTSTPLLMRRRRNGQLEAESSTDQMRHQIPELLSFISTFSTLEPGDLVTAGTPPAGPCGAGDTIEGEIEGIGTLRVHLADRPVDPRWQVVIAERT
jgi:2-keto-4-pentenoate hydratase/2-oxohepta-3-ene-1,7-dioic acid hydratase in catechol pathway